MAFQGDSIFWVDTDKVVPNPFQPRREFDQSKLQELSESIRMYGVLQPLTVTRAEVQNDDGTFYTQYELIAGERRLRASRLANVAQVPVIIREGEQSQQEKLELAIIENLQREDLNAVDRALAFQQLAEQFEMSHTQVAQKVGRSREYVSNSIRLLALPEHMRVALQRGELGEGHARTLLMLTDRPQEQETIFREILLKKMSVREVERIVRKIATDRVRKPSKGDIDEHLIEIEKEFTETLGTRVQILKTEFGGKLTIDYFSEEDLTAILKRMQFEAAQIPSSPVTPTTSAVEALAAVVATTPLEAVPDAPQSYSVPAAILPEPTAIQPENIAPVVREQIPTPTTPVVVADESAQVWSEPQTPSISEPVESIPTPTPNFTPTPSTASAPATAPIQQADPGLLAKLAAHTSFGFSRPQPAHEPDIQQPEVTEREGIQPQIVLPVVEPAQQILPVVAPVPLPEPVEPEEDIYSVRNFSI
jgi:ParB family chromosome partitioning protein